MAKSLLLVAAAFLAICSITAGLPGGAPTFGNVCNDLTQQHAGIAPISCVGALCPYTVSFTEVDGADVPAGKEGFYRCGSVHKLCIAASGGNQFRGFAIQARETSVDFASSSSNPLVGAFTNAPAVGGDWQIWSCPGGDSATHTNRVDKTEVCFDWMAPQVAVDVTFWFSITRVFATFHSQLQGLDLQPDPAFCVVPTPPPTSPPTTCSMTCGGEFANNQELSVNCELEGCTADSFTCQLDDAAATSCEIPSNISLAGLSVGSHSLTITATVSISGTTLQLQSTLTVPVSATLNCTGQGLSEGRLGLTCDSNIAATDATCSCFVNDEPFTPCDPFAEPDGVVINSRNYDVGVQYIFQISCTDATTGSATNTARLSFFGSGQITTVEPLNLVCQAVLLSDSQQVSISCSSSRDLSTLQFECSLDGESVTEGCGDFPFNISVAGQVGQHEVVLIATDSSGSSARATIRYNLGVPVTPGPTVAPLSLTCETVVLSDSQQVSINCSSSRDLSTLQFECSLDGESVTEGCGDFPFFISLAGQVGQHEVVLIATDSSGSSAQATIRYDLGVPVTPGPTVAPLSLTCETVVLSDSQQVSINCSSSRDLSTLQFECSLDGESVTEGCGDFPFNISVAGQVGQHEVVFIATDSSGSSARATIRYDLGAPVTPGPTVAPLSLTCETVVLSDSQQVSISCSSSRDLSTLQFECSLDGESVTEGCGDFPFNISVAGQVGQHEVVFIATDSSGSSARATIRYDLGVPVTPGPTVAPLSLTCETVVLSDSQQVSISCSSSRDLSTLQFECSLDGESVTEGCGDFPFNISVAGQVGQHEVVFIATDSSGSSARATIRYDLGVPVTPGPTVAPLSLTCETVVLSDSQQVSISCSSSRDLSTLQFECSLDGESVTEGCGDFPFNISVAGQVGQHEVVLIATDSSGSSARATIRYDLGAPVTPGPTVAPLSLTCETVVLSDSQQVSISCSSSRDLSTLQFECSLDGESVTEGCGDFPFNISVAGQVGQHEVVFIATDSSGSSARATIRYDLGAPVTPGPTVAPLSLTCETVVLSDSQQVSISCSSSRDLSTLQFECSLDGESVTEGCGDFPFNISVAGQVGQHEVVFIATDSSGSSARATIRYDLGAPVTPGPTVAPLSLTCETVVLSDSQQVSISCSSSRDLSTLQFECSLDGESVTEGCGDFPFNISVAGQVGQHEVVFIATDSSGSSARATIRYDLGVPVTPGPTVAPLSLTCETVVLSDSQQVSISCSSSRDLSTLQFECSLDGESVTEGCGDFPFNISVAGQVGQHEVVLIATDSSGSSARATIRYDLGAPVTPGPTVAPLSLTCETVVLSDSQQVSISCSSSRDLSTLQFECSLDGESVTEGCGDFPFNISVAGQVGQHEVVLIATDSSGSSARATIRYDLGAPVTPGPTVAPLSLTCEAVLLSDSQQVSISCSSNRDLSTLQFECSLDGESVTEGCGDFPFNIFVAGQVGQHEVVFIATDSSGSSAQTTIRYDLGAPVTPGPTLAPLSFSCQANFSPGSQLNISCSSSREISTLDIICFLDDIAQTDGCGEFPYIVSTAGQAGNHSVRFEVSGSDGSSASAVISYSLPPPTLQCFEIADALLISFGCSGAPYAIQNATCIYDDGRPSDVCDVSDIVIDQYTFTTGAHVLRIEFIDVQGNSGSFEYLFQGQVRERIPVGFQVTEFDLFEGDTVTASIGAFQGVSFGSIPLQVTPLACSDYVGNLADLFTNIPAASADPLVDLVDGSAQTIEAFAGGFRPPLKDVEFTARSGDLQEDEECLLLVLSFNEDDLVARDRGLVDLVGSVALVRIIDTTFVTPTDEVTPVPDPCLSNPCDPNASCTREGPMNMNFECKCNTPFVGNGFTCEISDPCLSIRPPCDPNADCIREGPLNDRFECICKPPFEGDGFTCELPPTTPPQPIAVVLSIEKESYTGAEGGLFEFCVVVVEGTITQPINATWHINIFKKYGPLSFSSGDTRVCSDIGVPEDRVYTGNRTGIISIVLDSAPPGTSLLRDSASLLITDNEVRPVATCEALDNFVENRDLQILPNCSRDDACTAVTCYNEDKDNTITICSIRFSCTRPSLGLVFFNDAGVRTLDRTITVDTIVPVSEQTGDLDVKLVSKNDSFIVSIDLIPPGSDVSVPAVSQVTIPVDTVNCPEFTVTCEETYLGPCGPLELSCSTEGEVDTVSCIFNNGSPEDCELKQTIDFTKYDPGFNEVVVSVSFTNGDVSRYPVTFIVPEPIDIQCLVAGVSGRVQITCSTDSCLVGDLMCGLSADGEMLDDVPCELGTPIIFGLPAFDAGVDYNLTVEGTGYRGGTDQEEIEFSITEPLLTFACELSDDRSTAICSSSIDGLVELSYTCSLDSQPSVPCGAGPNIVIPFNIGSLDPGPHTLTFEATSPSGQTAIFSFNIEVVPAFGLDCGFGSVSPSGPISVDCESVGGDVEGVVCDYDDGASIENCSLSFAIDFTRFSPGNHSLVVTATSTSGATSSFSTGFTVPEPLVLTCVQGAVSGRVEVTCSASKSLFQPLSCEVTADGGSPVNVPCAIDEAIVFSIPDFVPGVSYSLTVSGTDVDEQTDTEVVEFEIAPLSDFELTCGTSAVSPSGPISVTCGTLNGDAESVSCNYDDGAIVEDCSLNVAIDFTRFSPGGHSLVITATSASGDTSSFSTGFIVPEPLVLTCVQGAVSGRVEVTCSASKSLFQPLSCQVTADGGSPVNVPCANNETIVFSIPDFVPGVSYSLTVSGIDVDEQTDTEVVEFEIAPLPDFELTCGTSAVSPSGPISVTCGTANGDAESVSCNYDDGAIVEDCSLNVAIDFTRFSPGGHSLVITATSTSGATSSFSTGFAVPEPLVLTCVQGAVSGRVEVTCSASKPLFQPLSCEVTADGGSPVNVPCAIDEAIAFSIPDFVPGVSYSLTVRGIDVEEQTDTEVLEFEIAPLPDFELICGTSAVSPSGPISVTCNTVNGDAESVSCNYDDGAIVEDCSLNFAIDFTRFSPGNHSLIITATSTSGATSSFSSGFIVPEPLVLACVQGAVSGRVEVTCSASKPLFQSLSCEITADGGSPVTVPCAIDEAIVFSIPDFVPGVNYSLTVSGIDVDEQTDIEVVEFEIAPLPDFVLICGTSAVSPSGPISVTCGTVNGDAESVSCNYDDGAIVEDCSLNVAIDFTRFSPGGHSLIITATSTSGATSSFSTGFTVPEPLVLTCVQGAVSGRVEVTCSASKPLFQSLSCEVTADGGSPVTVPCAIDEAIVFSIPDFVPGVNYSLTVSGIDVDEQTDTEVVEFEIAPLPDFDLTCGTSAVSPSGPISVTCSTANGDAESVSCNYDNGAIVEDCSLNVAIDFTRFSPGGHSLVITATSTSGATSSFSTSFTVPEPLVLTCVQGAVSGRVEVTCSASKPLFQPLSCEVTADGGSPVNVPCAIDEAIAFSIPDFVPGVSYALTVRGIDVEEQTDTEVVEFEIAPLPDFELICGTSAVSPSGPISVTCNTVNGDAESVSCNYDDGAIVEDCSLNVAIDFTRFSPGNHSLVITATSTSGATSSFSTGFTVPEPLVLTCLQGAVSRRVEVTCSASKPLFQVLFCQVTADGGSPVTVPCSIDEAIVFSIPDFVPGVNYSLTVSGIDVDEQTDTEVVEFTLAEPLLSFNCELSVDQTAVTCTSSLDGVVPLSYTCTLDSQPPVSCGPGPEFVISAEPLSPGSHSFLVEVSSPGGQNGLSGNLFEVVPEKTLVCRPLIGTRLLRISCEVIGGTVDSAVCVYDNGSRIDDPCDLSFIEIDQFTFGPGQHKLLINYTCDNGDTGEFVYNFRGFFRPRISIGFDNDPLDISTTEGFGVFLSVQATGFSYGDVPIQVTPLACSDYEGDLEELFTNIPADSAVPAEDLANADVQEVTVNLGFLFSPPSFVGFLARPDNITENEECLVVELSVNEEELEDERDRGQVDFVRNVALIRIREIEAGLSCQPVFDLRLNTLICSGEPNPVHNASCSFDDGRPPLYPCDIDFLVVDQYTFSPGPHVLRIDFIDTFGNVGVFEYNFTGGVRPRISIDFNLDGVDLTVTEGQAIDFSVSAFGFSYGSFPVQLTALPCSGYPGDLSALFDNIPEDSASPVEDISGDQNVTINLDPGTFSRPPVILHQYTIVNDGISENEECLVFTLSVDEDELDARDRGNLDILRSVLLLRIEDGTLRCFQALNFASILVDCDADFVFDITTCSFDGAPAERCNLPVVIDQLQFTAGPHTLTIEAFGASVNDSTELQFNGIDEDTLPAVYVSFGSLGDTDVRILNVRETGFIVLPSDVPIIRVQGPTFGPVLFNVLSLTYKEFETQVSGRDLNNTFPFRPVAAGSGDFNSSTVSVGSDVSIFPQVIDDSEAELTEGYLLFLQLDVPNTDPRDVRRITYLNDIILVSIEDDDAIECSSSVDDDVATISCDDLDGQPANVTGELVCSIDFGIPEACFFPLSIPVSEFSPGRHNVRVLRREEGQPIPDEIIGGTSLNIEPLEVYFINDTPVLTVDRLFAEFRASRPNLTLECHLTHLDFTREDCSSGQFDRSGIPPGDYTLRVIARDPSRPLEKRAVARNRIWVHGDDVFCITGVQNRGLTINGNSATVEFYSTGVATGFKCVLDRTEIIENCTSPYTIEGLSLGRHHFKVIPLGCERLYRANTMQFNIN